MQLNITKAVFPVAGMGTRFLPATKANPKEMLPIVDKPLIQYGVEEAIAAGVKQLIFVTSYSKRAIEDHFDSNFELEARLQERGKESLLPVVEEILPEGVSCVYIRQRDPLGLGHAVLCAKDIVGNDAFAVILADDLIDSSPNGCLANMVAQFNEVQSSLIAVQEVPYEETNKYGIVALDGEHASMQIKKIIEKPKPNDAPSNFACIGRYILTPRIFTMLEQTERGRDGEIQLTDAIEKLLAYEKAYAYQLRGIRYDCGSKLGYLRATVEYALKHRDVADDFKDYLKKLNL